MFNFTPKRNSNQNYDTIFFPCQMSKNKQPTGLIKAHRNSYTLSVGIQIGVIPLKINFGIIYQIKMQIPPIGISQKERLTRVYKEVV